MNISFSSKNNRRLSAKEKADRVLKRSQKREEFFALAVKMISAAEQRGLRLIMENPWNEQTFLKANFVMSPTIVDKNRMQRGDYFIKPTAYFFINCEPTSLSTFQNDKQKKTIMTSRGGSQAGLCSEERSMISPDYARNFICDFIIGKPQKFTQLTIFDNI